LPDSATLTPFDAELSELARALDATHAALLANEAEALDQALRVQEASLARLLPQADALRKVPATLDRLTALMQQHSQLATLLAVRQAQTRGRLQALGVVPAATTYGQSANRSGARVFDRA